MNIINKLTLRQLRLNKRRTIVTIIGVALSVGMITAVTTLLASIMDFGQRTVIKNTGDWQVMYHQVPNNQISKISNDTNTKTAFVERDLGYATLKGSINNAKPYLFIQELDQVGYKTLPIHLVSGRLPKNEHEIVISDYIQKNAGVSYQIGDTLSLAIGKRHLTENPDATLNQKDGFQGEEEKLVTTTTKQFKVVGIIERPSFESFFSPGYTVLTYLNQKQLAANDKVDVTVTLDKVSTGIYKQAETLAKQIGLSKKNITYNKDLLEFYLISANDNVMVTFYYLAAIAIIIIMIGSISLIYNAFAISIAERSRHLGMLSSVGATKKQKKTSVYFESLAIGLVGIPLGLLAGLLGVKIAFILIGPFMRELIVEPGLSLKVALSPWAILVAIGFSVITLFFSAYFPARRASKITAIDAIRSTKEITLKRKTIKTSKLTRSLFGFEAELGLKNLKRNARKYRATVFSIVISIILFLSVATLSVYVRQGVELEGNDVNFDIAMNTSLSGKAALAVYEKMPTFEAVNDKTIVQVIQGETNLSEEKLSNFILKGDIYPKTDDNRFVIPIRVVTLDDEALQSYLKKIGVELEKMKASNTNPAILLNEQVIQFPGNKIGKGPVLDAKAGDKITIENFIGVDKKSDTQPEATIVTETKEMPIGMASSGVQLIVSEQTFGNLMKDSPANADVVESSMYFKSKNPDALENSLNEYLKTANIDGFVFNVARTAKMQAQIFQIIFGFLYAFTGLISMICVANIFNTISTSVALRKKEFAMLKSVGMTPKGFNKMINYESLFYGIKGLLYGLPLGLLIDYLIFKAVSNGMVTSLTIPWDSVIAVIVLVFLVVSMTMLYASSKVRKENVIDGLKQENI